MLKNVIIILLTALTVFGFVYNSDNTEPVPETTTYNYIYADEISEYIEYFIAETDKLITLKRTNEGKYFITIKENGLSDTAEITEQMYCSLFMVMKNDTLNSVKIVNGQVVIG